MQSITIFMAFSEGYKNRDLAIKSVIGSIISIFAAEKVAIKTVMAKKTVAIKTVMDCIRFDLYGNFFYHPLNSKLSSTHAAKGIGMAIIIY
jgi:hypothetical protein